MTWNRVSKTFPQKSKEDVLLATEDGYILGIFSGRSEEEEGEESWFIGSCYYDGDDPPYWGLVLPSIPPLT